MSKDYLDNVRRDNDYVILVYCLENTVPASVPIGMGSGEQVARVLQENQKRANELTEVLAETLKKEQLQGKVHQCYGRPGEEILRCAKEEKVNMIVTGTRGLGTIKRTLLGSVSDHLLHHSHVPLLVVKHDEDSNGTH